MKARGISITNYSLKALMPSFLETGKAVMDILSDGLLEALEMTCIGTEKVIDNLIPPLRKAVSATAEEGLWILYQIPGMALAALLGAFWAARKIREWIIRGWAMRKEIILEQKGETPQ